MAEIPSEIILDEALMPGPGRWSPEQCRTAAALAGNMALRSEVMELANVHNVPDPEGLWHDTIISMVSSAPRESMLGVAYRFARQKRNQPDPREILVDEFPDTDRVLPGFEEQTVDRMTLMQILRQIPEEHRLVLLGYAEEISVAKIAALLGLSVPGIKNRSGRIHQARRSAKGALTSQNFI